MFINNGLILTHFQCISLPEFHVQLPELPHELKHRYLLWWLTYCVVSRKHKVLPEKAQKCKIEIHL